MSEVTRYNKFAQSLLREENPLHPERIDAKEYVKFLLKNGSLEEKREIINCFKTKITLANKIISLQ